MLNLRLGIIEKIVESRNNVVELIVNINEVREKAIAYRMFLGKIEIGDMVIINTTAKDLDLGSGGYHYILGNLTRPSKESDVEGHIMKLRYTPLQIKVNACEEQKSPYHDIFNNFESLQNMPVIVGGLHSMVAPLSVIMKEFKRDIKICYIMTDGGALPIDFSKSIYYLKKKNIIDKTITIGHAFGGDLECINIYNGLIAAKEIAKCDIVIVTMGPGIVGTGTKFGFTGIEQGNIIDVVNDLGGLPICVPRISFGDSRNRHVGISHHTLTVLDKVVKSSAKIGIPMFDQEKSSVINDQIKNNNIDKKHDITFFEYNDIMEILKMSEVPMTTMGRNIEQDIEYFASIGVNGKLAINYLP